MYRTITKAALAATLFAALAGSAIAAATLTDAAKSALGAALEDEYKAEAFYAAVMDKFGASVRPFSNIINAERTHSSEVAALMKSHGLEVPKNPHLKDAKTAESVPSTLAEACKAGVKAEIDNRDLYAKQLLPAVASYPDIKVVFQSLRDASQNNHLPAFERCGSGGGGGQGPNR